MPETAMKGGVLPVAEVVGLYVRGVDINHPERYGRISRVLVGPLGALEDPEALLDFDLPAHVVMLVTGTHQSVAWGFRLYADSDRVLALTPAEVDDLRGDER